LWRAAEYETRGFLNMSSEELSLTPLLDGAVSPPPPESAELRECHRVAADPDSPLDDRLAAYEDLIAAEVGDTPLTRARNVERDHEIRQIYLKFEGANPTGTHKDRIAFAQVYDALRRGFDTVTVATCGNFGTALAFAASLAGLRCVVCVPSAYRTRRLEEMAAHGAEIRRTPGDYEGAVVASQELAGERELYDANPGGANTPIQLLAYAEIANEIYDELRDAPAAVAVPVSNGTCLAGIHRGFATLYRRGRISRMPKIVAGSSHGKNPIVRSFLLGMDSCQDLDPDTVRETRVNEPLVNWHSYDGDLALKAVLDTGGWAGDASDREMLRQAKRLREKEGLSVLPASTAGLSVLLAQHQKAGLPGDRYVAVLTGRR
jgi:threonine synthase